MLIFRLLDKNASKLSQERSSGELPCGYKPNIGIAEEKTTQVVKIHNV